MTRFKTDIHMRSVCATLTYLDSFQGLLFAYPRSRAPKHRQRALGRRLNNDISIEQLACLYMYQFEKNFILPVTNPFFNNIKLWRRYIDDILIIWQGAVPNIDLFTSWINTLDPFLKFTAHISTTQVPFLDLLIHNVNGKLVTGL
ncbi:hypothetical protein NDU88_003854 [Pleurodeles waltl]|uniref:Reverse transcriptase domain-containing protein n=1 Tax=Pleurodeles waltl TaxID=8319 RepID=A0AAV7LT49_PLEWA|nr:hypothetical protein NDU88_003854 [Pleurodeles waltl]